MGRVKALLPHPDGSGRTLVRAAAETLIEAGLEPLFVVLGHARQRIAPEVRGLSAVRPVLNPSWRSGMLTSLQAGIRTAAQAGAHWTVVCAVDQPFLTPELIRRLIARASRAPAAPAVVTVTEALERARRWSLPVLIGAPFFPEILAAPTPPASGREHADFGARAVLGRHRARIATVRADPSEILDLDTRSDFEATRARGAHRR